MVWVRVLVRVWVRARVRVSVAVPSCRGSVREPRVLSIIPVID